MKLIKLKLRALVCIGLLKDPARGPSNMLWSNVFANLAKVRYLNLHQLRMLSPLRFSLSSFFSSVWVSLERPQTFLDSVSLQTFFFFFNQLGMHLACAEWDICIVFSHWYIIDIAGHLGVSRNTEHLTAAS